MGIFSQKSLNPSIQDSPLQFIGGSKGGKREASEKHINKKSEISRTLMHETKVLGLRVYADDRAHEQIPH